MATTESNAKTFRESWMARLRCSSPTGSEWEVVILEAGLSKNGKSYPVSTLRESASIFDGLPIYAYQLGDKLDHAPIDVFKKMGGRLTANIVGQIRNSRYEPRLRAIVGTAYIDDSATRDVLLGAWNRGERNFLGLSIDAEGKMEGRTVTSLFNGSSVDLVTNPAAGGRFMRLVASCAAGELMREAFTEKAWVGDRSRFSLGELKNSVPSAVLDHAVSVASEEDRDVTKDDLKLPIREPNGDVNVNAIRSAKSALGGARGGVDLPSDVESAALEEIDALLEQYKQESSMKEAKGTEGVDVSAASDEEMKMVDERSTEADVENSVDIPLMMQQIISLADAVIMYGVREDQLKSLEDVKALAAAVGRDEEPEESEDPEEEPVADEKKTIDQKEAAGVDSTASSSAPEVTSSERAQRAIEAKVRASLALERVKLDLDAEKSSHTKTRESFDAAKAEIATLKQAIKDKALDFELQREAVELDIIDIDAASKLVDVSTVDVSEDGKVTGLRESLERLLESKPWLKKTKPTPVAETAPRVTESEEESSAPKTPAATLRRRMDNMKARSLRGDTDAVVEYRRLKRELNAAS